MSFVFRNRTTLIFFLSWLQFMVCKSDMIFAIPLGGNAYITDTANLGNPAKITDNGLENWTNKKSICSVYFKFNSSETFRVALRTRAPTQANIKVTIEQTSYTKSVLGLEDYIQDIGTFIKPSPGYVKLDLQGISRVGPTFGSVSHVILTGVNGSVMYIKDQPDFYFGRRGPSVHWNYQPVDTNQLQYFYNEVTVPKDQDRIGCYFMANGFADGYFGIQRNSDTERRVLFSIFADFNQNDPTKLNETQVILQKMGNGVEIMDFGNEGSGQQSYLKYNWKTGRTYKFLVYGSPDGATGTNYTAWFKAPKSDWRLIASFRKPTVSNYMKQLYSFSENFLPEQGYLSRKVFFKNQWVRNSTGSWQEVVTALFTGDATSMKGREDYAGGLSNSRKSFFLHNCGFFDEMTQAYTLFTRKPTNKKPVINLTHLNNLES